MRELNMDEVSEVSGALSNTTIRVLEFGVTFAGGLAAAMTLGVGIGVAAVAVGGAYAVGYGIGEIYNYLSE